MNKTKVKSISKSIYKIAPNLSALGYGKDKNGKIVMTDENKRETIKQVRKNGKGK